MAKTQRGSKGETPQPEASKQFQTRTVLAMATEMAEMKKSVERNCIMFAALAKSMGVEVGTESADYQD